MIVSRGFARGWVASAAASVAVLLWCPSGFAVDAIWTADATTGYLWDDAANWSTNAVPTGADAVILPTAIPEGGLAGEITLGADEEAESVRFRNRYAILLGDLFVPALYADMGVTGTIGSQLTGSGGLAKTGGGAIRLTNAANDYTGTTSIANGSLVIAANGALGADTSTVTVTGSATRGFGGGSLVLDGTAAGFTLSRNLSLQGYGPITDRGAALVSVGDNTLSGSVSVAAGTVNTRLISATGTLTFAGTFTANGVVGSTISMLGGTNQAGVGNYAITGTLAGNGMLEKQGAGMLLLNPASSSGFSGNVRISQSATGTQSSVRIISDGVLGTNVLSTSGSNVLDLNGGTLEIRMNTPSVTSGGAAANSYLRASSNLFVDHAPGGTAVNGTLTLGQQYFEDNLTLTLNGRNGYGITFGAAPVNGGENNSTITNNLGGNLTYTGTFWSNSNGTSRTMTIGGNGNTVISGNITAAAAGAVNHNLTKNGNGSLTITSTGSTLDGTVSINGGAVAITDFRSLTNNTATINIGTSTTAGILIVGTSVTPSAAGLTTSKVINLAGTTGAATIYANQPGTNQVVLNANFTATGGTSSNAKVLTLAGTNTAGNVVNGVIPNNAAGGAVSVTKFGPGTWILAGANTYTGTTTISNGTLVLQANAPAATVLPAGNAVSFSNTNSYAGGTLEFRGQAATANTLSLGTLTASAQGANRILLTPGAGGSVGLTFANVTTAGSTTLDIVGGGADASVAFELMNALNVGNALAGRTFFWNGGTYAFRETTSGLLRAPVYGVDAGTNVAAAGASTLSVTGGNYDVTGDITAQTTASIATMRMAGDRTVTLGSGQTLTLTGAGVLATGGSSTITGGTLALGGQVLVARANLPADVLTIASTITGTGGLTKSGNGTLVLSGVNTRTGTVELAQGTIRLSGSGTLSAANTTTNIRPAGTLDLGGVSTGSSIGSFTMLGTVTNSSATPATLQLGNNNNGGTIRGVIQDGAGRVSVTKIGTANMNFYGLATYTGPTTVGSTGLLVVDTMADIGQPSGIGAGDATSDATNAASLVFNGTTGGIAYQGQIVVGGSSALGSQSVSTNRLFTLAGTGAGAGARLTSTVGQNNAIVWSNPGPIAFGPGAAAQTLTLGGTSTGDNTFTPQLTDNGANRTSLTKADAGIWVLAGANNTYTGVTTVSNGTLALAGSGALPAGSPLLLGTGTTSVVVQASGTFTRPLATAATPGTGSITWGGTGGGGGFAAHGDKLVVALGGLGSPTPLTWGAGGFVGTGGTQQLILSSNTSLAETEFRNPIDLNGGDRTVNVASNGNTAGEFASITGAISGGSGSGLTKTGNGVLVLGGANTYAGRTTIQQGSVVARSLGHSGTPGQATSVGTSTGANLTGNAVVLSRVSNSGGLLQYVGPGERSDRRIELANDGGTSNPQIHADGAGPLVLENVALTSGVNKTLYLRGTNTQGNEITGGMANNGSAVLSLIVDGNATWILSGNNTYTGETTVGAGALGLGSDTVLTGTLAIGNGSVFAAGGDRTIASPVRLGDSVTAAVIGDNSLTFTSTVALSAAGGTTTLTNSLAPGAALNFAALTANNMTGNRQWIIGGAGTTTISGNITTSTAFGVQLTKTGTGTLTLGGTGGSNFNQNNAVINHDAGTIRFTAANAIPSGAGFGNVELTPEAADPDNTSVLDMAGFSQAINGLTANTNGTVVIDNSAAGDATLSFGGNDQAVSFGTGQGTYSITDSGAGRLSLRKTGTAAGTITSATLTYTGATEVTGGTLTVGSRANGTNGLSATGGGSLAMAGGLASPAAVAAVTVDAGSTLNLADGVGGGLANLTTLSLGATGSGTATLALDIGAGGTDTLTLLAGNTAALGNSVTFNLNDAGAQAGQTYTLLNVADGGLTAFGAGNLIQGVTPTGFSSATWNVTDTSVSLSLGSLLTGNAYWTGGTDSIWNAGVGNWSQDKAGTTPVAGVPGQGNDIVFLADTNLGGAVTTSLGQNFRVNSLAFETSTAPATSVTIDGGLSAARLAVAPQSAAQGITMSATGPAAVTIAAGLDLAAAQTWNVADAAGVLTVSGGLGGSAALTKTGPGTAVLSAAAAPSFNAAGTAAVTVSGGSLALGNAAALGYAANAPAVTVGSGGAFYTNAASTTTPVPIVLSGGTLSAGTATQTYSGSMNVTAESTINMRDSASGTTAATARNIALPGAISGSGRIVVDSNDAASGGNQMNGQLTFSGDNSAWSGGMRLLRGTVSFTNPAALGTGGIVADRGRVYFQSPGGTAFTVANDLTIDAPGGVLELQPDATTNADLNVNLAGVVTLGSASNANMGLRLYLATDNYSGIDLSNSVVLGNNASISVGGGTRLPAVISGVISETGGPRVLTINDDFGGWNTTNRTLSLTNANTYTGGTVLSSGTLSLGNKDALGTGGLTVNANSVLQLSVDMTPAGAGALPNDVALAAGLTVSGNNSLALAGAVTNSGGNRTLTNSLPAGKAVAISGPVNLSELAGTGRTLTVTGTGTTEITGVVADVAGGAGTAGGLTKTGTGTLRLGGANTYTGITTVDNGTLELTAAQSLAGGLRFGSATAATTAGTVEVAAADATFGGLTVQSNSAINIPRITIGSGRTLTVNGDVTLGSTVDRANVQLNVSGGGSFVVNGGSFRMGVSGGATNATNRTTVDLSGIASFTATMTNQFTVQFQADNDSSDPATLFLSNTANTVSTPLLAVGASQGGAGTVNSTPNTMFLGAGTNVLNAGTVRLGSGTRDSGRIVFGGAAGSVTLRGQSGTGRADVTMGNATNQTTAYTTTNVFDTTGHAADLAIGTLTMAPATKTAAMTNTFSFDTGTLDIATLDMAKVKGTGVSTNTLNLGGGTVSIGNSGAGAAIIATAATGVVNITGGTVTSSVPFTRAGAGSATVNLTGGTLDLTGNTIGDSVLPIALAATGGTLANVSEFNGGATLAKAGAGVLTLAGTNTWTGQTDIQAGEIRAGAAGGLSPASTFVVGPGAFLSLAGNAAAVGGLAGTGTVRNNAATAGTLTVATSGTTFNGLIEDGVGGGSLAVATSGSGIFTLATANTYSGGTAINAGRLVATNAAALGGGNVTIASGGILELDLTPTLGGSTIAMSPGGRLVVASGVAAPLAGLSALGGWEIDPSTLGLGTVGRLLSGTVPAGGTTLSGTWVAAAADGLYSDVLELSGTGAGNPFVLSMSYDPAVESGLLVNLNIGRRNTGSSDPFATLGTSFQGVGVQWTSAFTTVGQYGVDTASQTVWVVSDTNSEFAIVPEPATLALAGVAAAVGAAWAARRRRAGGSRSGQRGS